MATVWPSGPGSGEGPPGCTPAALVWCCRRPGRDLRDRVEPWLPWQKVRSETDSGNMGPEFERSELNAVAQRVQNAGQEAPIKAEAHIREMGAGLGLGREDSEKRADQNLAQGVTTIWNTDQSRGAAER